jgi:hypothetical protein
MVGGARGVQRATRTEQPSLRVVDKVYALKAELGNILFVVRGTLDTIATLLHFLYGHHATSRISPPSSPTSTGVTQPEERPILPCESTCLAGARGGGAGSGRARLLLRIRGRTLFSQDYRDRLVSSTGRAYPRMPRPLPER